MYVGGERENGIGAHEPGAAEHRWRDGSGEGRDDEVEEAPAVGRPRRPAVYPCRQQPAEPPHHGLGSRWLARLAGETRRSPDRHSPLAGAHVPDREAHGKGRRPVARATARLGAARGEGDHGDDRGVPRRRWPELALPRQRLGERSQDQLARREASGPLRTAERRERQLRRPEVTPPLARILLRGCLARRGGRHPLPAYPCEVPEPPANQHRTGAPPSRLRPPSAWADAAPGLAGLRRRRARTSTSCSPVIHEVHREGQHPQPVCHRVVHAEQHGSLRPPERTVEPLEQLQPPERPIPREWFGHASGDERLERRPVARCRHVEIEHVDGEVRRPLVLPPGPPEHSSGSARHPSQPGQLLDCPCHDGPDCVEVHPAAGQFGSVEQRDCANVLGHTGSVHVEEERILWSKGLHDASLSRAARPGPRAFHRIDSRSGAPAPSAPSGQSRRRPRLAAPRPPTSRSEYGAFPSTGGLSLRRRGAKGLR